MEGSALSLSDAAVKKIGQLLSGKTSSLRVAVEGGGCSGFQYRFSLDNQAPRDAVIQRENAKVIIDPVSLYYLQGSEIDFVEELMGTSFKINNPNASASCGCGNSIAF